MIHGASTMVQPIAVPPSQAPAQPEIPTSLPENDVKDPVKHDPSKRDQDQERRAPTPTPSR